MSLDTSGATKALRVVDVLQMWVNFLSLYRYCTICEQQQHSGIKIWYLLTKSSACDCCHWLEFDAFFTYVGRFVQLVVVTLHWSVKLVVTIATLCPGPQAIHSPSHRYQGVSVQVCLVVQWYYCTTRHTCTDAPNICDLASVLPVPRALRWASCGPARITGRPAQACIYCN